MSHSIPTTAGLPVVRQHVTIELRGRGRLVPWLGPAFRGITALRHRAATCRQPKETWLSLWQYCRGCPLMGECDYGTLFEPDAPAHSDGSRDAPRPLVIAPTFPLPTEATPGTTFDLDLLAIGGRATAALPGVMQALVDAGRFDGLGPDRVRFEAVATGSLTRTVIAAGALPKAAATEPVAHAVTIRLAGPLFLRDRSQPGTRRRMEAPGLMHLLRASMRVAREFLGEEALCPEQGHLDLDDLAKAIEPIACDLRPFAQQKSSHRSRERFGLEGVTGSWTFAAVPVCLLPWLHLGGLLHVGGHRIAGAGGWHLGIGEASRGSEP